MLTMAHRVPVLHELQNQLNIRVGSSSGPVLCRAQAGHTHGHGHKTQLPGLALFNEGARHHPAGTTTLPGFPPLDQGELWGPESFPHHIQGADSHPQHQQQDPTQSSAGPTTCLPCTPLLLPWREDTELAGMAPTGRQRDTQGTASSWDFKDYGRTENCSAPRVFCSTFKLPQKIPSPNKCRVKSSLC